MADRLPEVKIVGARGRRAPHIIAFGAIFLTVAPDKDVLVPPEIVQDLLTKPKLRRMLESGAEKGLYSIYGLPAAA